MKVLRGGLLVTADGLVAADVLLERGVIAAIGDLGSVDAEVLDCTGCWIGPAFVDLHVHLREPGHTHKENIMSGATAAAAGGFGALVAMANTDPPIDTPAAVERIRDLARKAPVDVIPAATITAGRAGRAPGPLTELHRNGVTVFSDDGDWVADEEVLREAMSVIASFDGLLAQHAEAHHPTGRGVMHEGPVSELLGLPGMPATDESRAIARDLELVAETGCRYHAQHVSTAAGLELLTRAREAGLPVTIEVTPHHLVLDHTELKTGDTAFKMNPPLRPAEDVAALRVGLLKGDIDIIATDHAPHTRDEKSVDFKEAPFGVIGLETAAAAVQTELDLDPHALFRLLSVRPAEIGGIPGHGVWPAVGSPANLVAFDPGQRWTPREFRSRSENSPFRDRPLVGAPRFTWRRGEMTHRAGDS